MVNYLPLATTVVAFVFFILLAYQYWHRRKTHQLLWTVAMLFFSLSALMEFLMNPDLIGANVTVFRFYYILAAPLVGLLGAGVMHLITKRRISNYFLGFVIIFSLGLVVTGLTTPLNQDIIVDSFSGSLAEGFRDASHAYPMTVRFFAIILNSVGGIVLIGGALLSFVMDRSRTYNILIAIGGILPMVGGSLLGFFQNPDLFFEFELGGTVFLFLGFILSTRYITKKERIPTRKE